MKIKKTATQLVEKVLFGWKIYDPTRNYLLYWQPQGLGGNVSMECTICKIKTSLYTHTHTPLAQTWPIAPRHHFLCEDFPSQVRSRFPALRCPRPRPSLIIILCPTVCLSTGQNPVLFIAEFPMPGELPGPESAGWMCNKRTDEFPPLTVTLCLCFGL